MLPIIVIINNNILFIFLRNALPRVPYKKNNNNSIYEKTKESHTKNRFYFENLVNRFM